VILVVSPAPPTAVLGNGVTAERWSKILRGLGYDVHNAPTYEPGRYSALIALHAGKSADSVRAFHAANPSTPIILALTGTDLYPDLASTGVDPAVLRLAHRIIVLQERGLDQLDDELRSRARVIVQSMPLIEKQRSLEDVFEVSFLAHLRAVKDPLLVAKATRLLPAHSRIQVSHAGTGLDSSLAAEATRETQDNPRYSWLGELPRERALQLLSRSRLMVLTSRHEGGANVISEALAAGVPVIASAIPGSQGLLGENYPGYFPVGDASALADRLIAAETNRNGFYLELSERCIALQSLVDPTRERQEWSRILAELGYLGQESRDIHRGKE
jgi:putative glycosyltransferase (TIGR04348 family)